MPSWSVRPFRYSWVELRYLEVESTSVTECWNVAVQLKLEGTDFIEKNLSVILPPRKDQARPSVVLTRRTEKANRIDERRRTNHPTNLPSLSLGLFARRAKTRWGELRLIRERTRTYEIPFCCSLFVVRRFVHLSNAILLLPIIGLSPVCMPVGKFYFHFHAKRALCSPQFLQDARIE